MNISIIINGKEVGTTTSESIEVSYEKGEIKTPNNIPVYTYVKSKTYSAKLENVTFDTNYFNKHKPENRYKVVATGLKLPKGIRMPKTKRLIKKYKKKYTYTIEFDNCVLR
jgi:hypothetical protein